MPLHISLVLSLVFHLAVYTIAAWAGLRAPPPPPAQSIIEAMLILPQMTPPPAENAPGEPLPESPPPAVPMPPPPVIEPPPSRPLPQSAAAPVPPKTAKEGRQLPFYPPEAILRGLEGDVEVGVTLDAGGNVISARIDRGSGHAILDEAALRAVRALKPLPGGWRQAVLPVRFRLK